MKGKTEAVLSCHERNRKKLERTQRVITFARKRAGLRQREVAAKIYVATGTLAHYEVGRLKAPWEALEKVLPELKEMREQTCEAYCEYSEACKDGLCRLRKHRVKGERKGQKDGTADLL